jgi:hypothetical protein
MAGRLSKKETCGILFHTIKKGDRDGLQRRVEGGALDVLKEVLTWKPGS